MSIALLLSRHTRLFTLIRLESANKTNSNFRVMTDDDDAGFWKLVSRENDEIKSSEKSVRVSQTPENV